MQHDIQAQMREATRLTQAGRLKEATAVIQRTLCGETVPPTAPSAPTPNDDTIIEGTFRVVESGQAAAATSASAPPNPSVNAATSQRRDVSASRDNHRKRPLLPKLPRLPFSPRPAQPQTAPVQPPPAPQRPRESRSTGQFLAGTHTNQAGTRSYKLYVPSGYHGQTLPLVVMLHGCTQSPDDFAAGTRMNSLAEQQQFFVVYPAQVQNANSSKCWNWFKRSQQRRDQGEPSIIADITRHVMHSYAVDARRVYVAGLSAGGAMAQIMAVTYPELYAAVGVHSGLAYGAARDVPSAFAAMRNGAQGRQGRDAPHLDRIVPAIVFHGDADTTVDQRNGAQVIAQWLGVQPGAPQVRVQRSQAPAGRTYTRSIYEANGQPVLEQWLIHGAGHAWAGGSPSGSYTDATGPDASAEMLRFFFAHPQRS